MKIGVVQATSQISKNRILFEYTKKYAKGEEVINFGCFENEQYSYLDIAILIGILINRKIVDFVVTGCSSGQGMMLACNSMPNVLCGYAPSSKDAYLFAQINNGNVISLPLGEEYTYQGEKNLEETIQALFSEPFGGGYPKSEAQRKIRDANRLKEIKTLTQKSFDEVMAKLDPNLVKKLLEKINDIGSVKHA